MSSKAPRVPRHRWGGFLSQRDAAEYLGISQDSLAKLVAADKLPLKAITERRVGIPKYALDEFIENLPRANTSAGRVARRPKFDSPNGANQ